MLQVQHSALYAAFDVYPSAKGAATHIFHFAETLFETMQGGWLHTLASPKLSSYQQEENIEITRFEGQIPNFLQRIDAYSEDLFQKLQSQNQLEIAHFRDPWSGLPIILNQEKNKKDYLTVYEVNGLSTIELPYRYPKISNLTLQKIQKLEKYCLEKADYILTPSQVIQQNLVNQGIQAAKIQVISNGASLVNPLPKPDEAPSQYLIYFGALQTWQGLDILLKAMNYLADFSDLKLVICVSNREKFSKYYQKLAEKWHLDEKIIWRFQLPKKELYAWVQHAQLSIAPLTECTRNLQQGCCPLKILESMALATPVVASDIPAIREIIASSDLGKLIRPDRPQELARTIRVLLEEPKYTQKMGLNGQNHIRENFTWDLKKAELKAFYQKILAKTSKIPANDSDLKIIQ